MEKNKLTKKLISIGECLIDEIHYPGRGANIENMPGGAPANVAVCHAQLGGRAVMLTKLGQDPQGELLIATLQEKKVDTTHIVMTDAHVTTKAIVHIDKKGERSFKFDRRNSADLFFQTSEVPLSIFEEGDVLHFGSVDLVPSLMKDATSYAIRNAKQKGLFLSFDVNLRFPLWPSEDRLRLTVKEFLLGVDLVKFAEDELRFVYPNVEEKDAVKDLLENQKVRMVLVSRGANGATLFTLKNKPIDVKGTKVKVVDATGAGDALVGAFLHQIIQSGMKKDKLTSAPKDLKKWLTFANQVASYVVTKPGAIPAMPTLADLKK